MAIVAGQDILAEDVAHIRKIILQASEDLSAGDKVGVSLLGSGVAKALSNSALAKHSVTYADTPTQNQAVLTPISGDKFFIVYEKTNTTLRGVIGTIDRDTMTVSLGTAVDITTDSYKIESGTVDMCSIDTDKVVISYVSDADKTITKAVVCTVSGTTITVGTPQTIKDYASGTMSVTAVCKLDTNKFAYFNNEGATLNNEVFACTVSGTVITVGTPVVTGANIVDICVIRQMTTNKFIIASIGEYIQIGTVSGTTITLGSQQNASLTGVSGFDKLDLVCHSTSAFVIRGNSSAKAATVSGTVATFGSEVTLAGSGGSLRVQDSSTVYVSNEANRGIQKMSISGNTITLSTITNTRFTFYTENSSGRNGFMNMGNGYWAMVRGSNTTGIMFFIEGQSIQFIGIAQSSVSRGADVEVLIGGIDETQSGLTAGETYAVSYGGDLVLQEPTETDVTPDNVHIVKAISATSIIL